MGPILARPPQRGNHHTMLVARNASHEATLPNETPRRARVCPLVAVAWAVAAAALLTAHGFEKIGGYVPCTACYGQRSIYNVTLPVMAGLLIGAAFSSKAFTGRVLAAAAAAIGAVGFSYGAWLATVHAGAEWGFWGIGGACGTPPVAIDVDDYVARIMATPFVDCLSPSLRILGLSFAGWNGLVSIVVAGLSAAAFLHCLRRSKNGLCCIWG